MIRRHGFTIIELLVTMSVGSALMVLAVGLVHQTLSLSTAARLRNDHMRSLNRLAQQFRTDVHRATSCSVVSPDQMRLEMPDDSLVTFRAESNIVDRTQTIDDGSTRRTRYLLSTDASAGFATLDAPNRAIVTVVRSTNFTPHESLDRRTEAVVGHTSSLERAEVNH